MKRFKNWKKSAGLILVIIIALSVLFIKVPLYFQARSYVVMYAFSKYQEKKSLIEKQDIPINIPGGSSTKEKDWYPFVMVFNDNQGFSQYMGRNLALTIIYNFGGFHWNSSSSTFFQEDSPYFNSFYGGYLIQEDIANAEKQYGFTADGKPDIKEVLAVAKYDFTQLVIKSFDCPDEKLTMELLSYKLTENVEYAGYSDWVKIDSLLLVNSPEHKFKGGRKAYIPYGNPLKKDNTEDFRLITTNARVYMRYFKEYNCTIFLYIMSPNYLTMKTTDDNILSKTEIGKNK